MREIRIEKSFTNRDSDSLNRYLSEINKIDLISADEEVRLSRKIKLGDEQAYEKLVKANLRFVISCAKKYQGVGLSLGDLVSEGNLGLMKAARMFDESKGFKFISYAVWWIRQAMLSAISEHMRMIRLPMNQILTINKIKHNAASLEQSLEREPTIEELAEVMETESDIIAKTLGQDGHMKSLDEKVSEDSDLDIGGGLADPNTLDADHLVIKSSLGVEAERLLASLGKRDANILRQIMGIGGEGPMTLEEVAIRNDLSKERVRQIRASTISQLRKANLTRLKEYI
ncbi:sigma-70 family RNA polymerase sigma factor [Pedobacter deserti]|uniref:sigma-70 family RNA polymerase sigma factor n=1 Tax=Pedobacter deserti TaxID=2817382 RepID=UPI0021091B4F|nr:RNA polymerase sigma factor RpoD/SigA [Pedobacter sp. SYSU D00382]